MDKTSLKQLVGKKGVDAVLSTLTNSHISEKEKSFYESCYLLVGGFPNLSLLYQLS